MVYLYARRTPYVNGVYSCDGRKYVRESAYLGHLHIRRDSEHARAFTVRSAVHLHGVTLYLNVSRPLPSYFELGGLTPTNLCYAGAT